MNVVDLMSKHKVIGVDTMSEYLLSIVVPTKNRYKYLYSLIEQICYINDKRIELVIQDNTEDNKEFEGYLNDHSFPFVHYYWDNKQYTVCENSDLGVLHAKGEYICFVGDDDIVSRYLIGFTEKMQEEGIEGAIFNRAVYDWPGVTRVATHTFNVTIPRFTGEKIHLNGTKEQHKILQRCGTSLGRLPSLYQGVIRKSVLDKVRDACGTYFPGPSPDMGIAIVLPYYIGEYVYCDLPLVSSGASPKSAAGLGAKHQHKGELKNKSFLPSDIEEQWEKRIPMIWTAETIYAQSIFAALKNANKEHDLKLFNFEYLYAGFAMFEKDYKGLLKNPNIEGTYNKGKCNLYYTSLFIQRIYWFMYNRTIKRLNLDGTKHYDDIKDSFAAMKIIDDEIKSKGF